MADTTPADEGPILSPEAQRVMDLINQLSPTDRGTLLTRIEYDDAMKVYAAQQAQLLRCEEEQKRQSS
jgi:hypothetical protein